MGKVDLEKMRSIKVSGKHRGKSRVRSLISEQGRTTGFEIDYPDGRQAAVVRPETVNATMSVDQGLVK